MIGDDLYPLVYSYGKNSASCDGITKDGTTAFEHKQWSQSLSESVRNNVLPEEHVPQCQQILDVTGAEKLIFVVSDGTPDHFESMWVYPDIEFIANIDAVWAQFDVANYVHVAPDVEIVAAPIADFPALFVQAKGEVTNSNVAEARAEFLARLESLQKYKKPASDQEFADGKAAAKKLREFSKRIRAQTPGILAQAQSIGNVVETIKLMAEMADADALAIEKAVDAEEKNRKESMIAGGKSELEAAIKEHSFGFGAVKMPAIPADFAGAIKGKRNTYSMKNAVDSVVAAGKILTKQYATAILANLKLLESIDEYKFLFPDSATLALKPVDDLQAVIDSRVAKHKEAERVKAEEAAAKAKAKNEAEEKARWQVATLRVEREQQAIARVEQSATPSEALIISIITNLRRMDEWQMNMAEHYCERLLSHHAEAA